MLNDTNLFDCHPLFEDVQLNSIFADGKTFVDCVPMAPNAVILQKYLEQKAQPGFSLKEFVLRNFELPVSFDSGFESDTHKSVEAHIQDLWAVLTRQPDEKRGSLIPLPYPYIVPGGRFGEVYYWDSYFTMLGLKESGLVQMIEHMIGNFSHLINTIGYIPNGNRTYYLGRSQPPFFALMVQLLAGMKGKKVLSDYLHALEAEYRFWMKGKMGINDLCSFSYQVVRMRDGELLNRYFDENDTPRPESYKEDVELAHQADQPGPQLFSNLRAGAASGWDYSSRWFKDGIHFTSIHTTELVPVDLNSLLYYLEQTIAKAYEFRGDTNTVNHYLALAEKRTEAIRKYCWNPGINFYVDFDAGSDRPKALMSLAAVSPLFFNLATQQQADQVARILESSFLKAGGLVTTLQETGQQWDSPNGWAPLQWMAIIGLENYGHHALAARIAKSWIQLNTDVFNRTGKLMEKYNVVNSQLEAGGGEYAGQDGFGWTNGVLLALIHKYKV